MPESSVTFSRFYLVFQKIMSYKAILPSYNSRHGTWAKIQGWTRSSGGQWG